MNFHAFFIKSIILHLWHHHFKSLFKPLEWFGWFNSISTCSRVHLCLKESALIFNFIAIPVFIPSWTSVHSDILFFICSHSHFTRRADNEALFGEEVKRRYEWENSSLFISANNVFISTVMIIWQLACLYQHPSQKEMQHAHFLKLYHVFGTTRQTSIPTSAGFCKTLHYFFLKHWDLLSALTHKVSTGTDATLLSGHKLIPGPESMEIFSIVQDKTIK